MATTSAPPAFPRRVFYCFQPLSSASHGLGTAGGGEAAVHQVQAVLASTGARTLAPGAGLKSSWQTVTFISKEMVMEKPANRYVNQSNWLTILSIYSVFIAGCCVDADLVYGSF